MLRYRTTDDGTVDGLSGREGAFLACSFWLADCLHLIGRGDDARALFERLLAVRNDLGLLSEEYDPVAGRLVGNFPQAFSHVSLVNTAFRLSGHAGPSDQAPEGGPPRVRRRLLADGHPGARGGGCDATGPPATPAIVPVNNVPTVVDAPLAVTRTRRRTL